MDISLLNNLFNGNSAADYIRAAVIVAAGTLVLVLAGLLLKRTVKRIEARNVELEQGSETDKPPHRLRSAAPYRVVQKIVLPLLFLAVLSAGLSQLTFESTALAIVKGVFSSIVTIIVIRAVNKSFEFTFSRYFSRESMSSHERNLKPLLVLVKFVIWIVGITFLLANLGFDVTAAVAGLGVSGIAVAIAAQGILGDLFNYFVILFDKPFELGDFIIFDDKLGVVETIGIKTTRIRTLQGEVLVVSNSDLAGSRLHNFKKMTRRRVILKIGVVYQTSLEHIKEIPVIIRGIIESVEAFPGIICDRSHFQGFGAFSLDFETVYYVPTPDYTLYMNVQQEINQRIFAAFEEKGIEFAYPTQTLFISRDAEGQS
jgi:small-conductance mechanosensitive channel